VFSKKFLKDTAERVGSSFAQVVVALILPFAVQGKGLSAVPWLFVLDVAGLVALLCLLKCCIATRVNDSQSASLVDLNKGSK
jgi:hypothetical protein